MLLPQSPKLRSKLERMPSSSEESVNIESQQPRQRGRVLVVLLFVLVCAVLGVIVFVSNTQLLRKSTQEVKVSTRHRGAVCRNTFQGRLLLTDERGFTCTRDALSRNESGCCDSSSVRYSCESCENACCVKFEQCVSCCLNASMPKDLPDPLSKLTDDHFALCMYACRTSSHQLNENFKVRFEFEFELLTEISQYKHNRKHCFYV
jgi:hypothetical protein